MNALPDGQFATVLADPPWPYGDAGKKWAVIAKDRGQQRVNDLTYETLTLPEIAGLPVRARAAKNAHLYLWTTNAFMREAHQVALRWGFVPKTIITWVKVKADGTPSMKTGYYFRGATEHILFAVRGSLKLQTNRAIPTALLLPRVHQHSRKPDEVYDLIEECSPEPRLELFARRAREGWTSWGDQVEC